ncbi:hypothetical protein BD324DRAFT_581530 [Kockovaella imperatae]|uniref:Uncharacterized protein n=1 Tax=Kockovaella imperatae TaxID=4999 RepID=A0A1Y1UDF7_9TREE|nr:hypothetical protein BD324DRAFT_581530 [Kockovaella imperatae]ORX36052.1 hypothetical protein BD324DRAFT_581530 [Kockovaella imperatae]
MVLLQPNAFVENAFKTREDVERGCIALLEPLKAHTSAGGALIDIGSTATHYDLRAVALETFARPIWGLTSLLVGGGHYEGVERWVRGLANGTDPKGPEYWGGAKAKDQRMVEMSPLSFAISMAPDVFFSGQSDEAKENISAFLQTCIGKPMPDTNWLWFRVFANLALRTIKSPHFNPEQMSRDLARLEEFQFPPHPPTGDSSGSGGWSNDGPEDVHQTDYYSSSFAIQFAQMTYAKLCAKTDPERSQKFIDRARQFVLDFVYYFNDDGAAIPFGRSMVYRFAVISTFSAMVLADVEPPAPLQWGHIKGLVLRHLRSWTGKTAIFRSDGTLNIGYGYDNMNMTENYNAPGSPYWCMKAFACLAAPPTHPFWSCSELPWPSDLFPLLKAIPDPHHIMCRHGNHTFLLSSGQQPHYAMRHGPSKYCKFAYSSVFGFSCATGDMDIAQTAGDSMLALKDATPGVENGDGETWRVRRKPIDAEIVGRGTPRVHLRSSWKPWKDVTVETWLLPPQADSPNWYLRVHRLRSDRPLLTSEGGWSTYGQGDDGRAVVQSFSGETSRGGEEQVGWARVTTQPGCVGILDLTKGQDKRKGILVQTDPQSNVIFSRSVLPSLQGTLEAGETWLITAVFGLPHTGEARYTEEWNKQPVVPDWIFS